MTYNNRAYFPHEIFGNDPTDDLTAARVIISPHRYIQGKGVIDKLGLYISVLPSTRPMILISVGGEKRFGQRIRENFHQHQINPVFRIFEGECSHEGIRRVVESVDEDDTVDAVIAVGGGKCLDAGKGIAFRLDTPVVIVPTIASTDAPCSAVSVMYTEEGVGIGPEFYPNSPALVIMDTEIIAASPVRHLVAGMGDALATYYEARTCFNNPSARNMVGGRPTIAVLAIAELSARTLYEQGLEAKNAIEQGIVNEALEQIIETNTLLSGMGFESGGLAAAHGVAAGLTVIPALHNDYLHGELVGVGLMTHLILEEECEEAKRVTRFCCEVGLPVHLGQLSLDVDADLGLIKAAMEASVESQLPRSEPFEVTSENLLGALLEADQLGREVIGHLGDAPFQKLHS